MSPDQKGYAAVAAQSAINGHFERTGAPFRSVDGFAPGCTAVRPSRLFDTPVSIVIPALTGLDLLRTCVESIRARDHAFTEILIVYEGSDDPEMLAWLETVSRQADVRILRDPGASNPSRARTMAAERAKGKLLCFLDGAAEVVSVDWLNRARAFLSQDEVGVVGARLLCPDGTLRHLGMALGMGRHRIAGIPHLGLDAALPGYFGKARLLQEVSAVSAACLFVRRVDYLAVGGFDEKLSAPCRDVDFCLKIRGRGLKVLADPDITLIERGTRTADDDGPSPGDAARMRAHWSDALEDPYYSPNLDLGRNDFAYAPCPRQPWPWADTAAA